jgi:hypothetical protein
VCRGYFNPGFVGVVDAMVKDAPEIDLWDRLEAVG